MLMSFSPRANAFRTRENLLYWINRFGTCINSNTRIRVKAVELTPHGDETSVNTQACKLVFSGFEKSNLSTLRDKGKSVVCALTTGSIQTGIVRACCFLTVESATHIKVSTTGGNCSLKLSLWRGTENYMY